MFSTDIDKKMKKNANILDLYKSYSNFFSSVQFK